METMEYYQSLINHVVEIQCNDGSILVGKIASVDASNVYINPLETNEMQRGGQEDSRFFWGPGIGGQAFLGGFAGSLLGVGLSSIIGVRPYPPYYPPYGPGPFPPYGPPRPPYGPIYGPGPFY
ncbi:hypothetical protein [Sporolactobacillus vineae]|uniref:hypothetical protein n=1 Tax=Sporolactobacillus vineae TaxID=444463 RepID=UPI00028819E2|nr:hypothetical protein [Sporolactobacillus vineae]